ncbi:hypothetical protein [Sphingomonas sp. F9_3S_D5_B_2]
MVIPLLFGSTQAHALPGQTNAGPSLSALLWDLGQCVVRKNHDEVQAYLLADAPSGKIDRNRVPSDRACLSVFDGNSQATFTVDSYRGALANALVQHDFASAPALNWPRARQANAEANSSRGPQGKRGTGTRDLRHRWEAENASLGECVVGANAEDARVWILTAPDSTEDSAQAKALWPAFEQCAKAASIVRVDFDREVMRGPIALAYVRLAK